MNKKQKLTNWVKIHQSQHTKVLMLNSTSLFSETFATMMDSSEKPNLFGGGGGGGRGGGGGV